AVPGFVVEHWQAKLDGREHTLIADQIVLRIPSNCVEAAQAELLQRQERVISPLRVGSEDELVCGMEKALDILRLPLPVQKLSITRSAVVSCVKNIQADVERGTQGEHVVFTAVHP